MTILIRPATPADAERITYFNAQLALETEDKELDEVTLEKGVRYALEKGALSYWVAVDDGLVIGQAGTTKEWSDWRNGWLWWFQSVYIATSHRKRGVFRALHNAIVEAAQAQDVVGLRLYVEQGNTRAQETYKQLSMTDAGYRVMEMLL